MRENSDKEKRTQANFRLPNDLLEKLRKTADLQGKSVSSLVEAFLKKGIELANSSDPLIEKVRVSEIESFIETIKLLQQRVSLLEAHVARLLEQNECLMKYQSVIQLPTNTETIVQVQSTATVASAQINHCSKALKPHEAHKIAQKYGYTRTVKALSALARSSPDPASTYAKLGLKADLSLRGAVGEARAWFFALNEADLSVLEDEGGVSFHNSGFASNRKLPEELKALIDLDDYDTDGWLCLAGAYKIALKKGYPGTRSKFKAIAHKRNAETEYRQWGLESDWNRRRSDNAKSYWLRPTLETIDNLTDILG